MNDKEFCVHCRTVYLTQQQKDDLECAEIERGLLDKEYGIRIFKSVRFNEIGMNVYDPDKTLGITTRGATKLEALRKAKNWMDGRGALNE